jgi:hypothetical protein
MADPNRPDVRDDTPASPYGPQPRGVDEAAGGADSSPYDNEASGERMDKAEEDRRTVRGSDPDTRPGQKP